MNPKEINEAIERYNKRLDEFGVSEKALGWGDKGRSRLRFEILLSQWDFDGKSILDFGCGFGSLYGYMKEKGIKEFSYTGIDINERLAEIAKQQYKEARFITGNLLSDMFNDKVDYVLSSGVFNFQLKDNYGFIRSCFDKFNEIAGKGFAVNFLSDKAVMQYESIHYSNAARIVEMAYQYSNNIVLRNDYMPYEFSIFINKAAEVDPDLTVYKEYKKYV